MSDSEEIIISYGKKMILQMVIVFAVSLVVGIVLRIPAKIIMFLVCIVPLRQNAGGVHMTSRIGCLISTMAILIASAFIIKYVDIPYGIQMLTMCLSSICIVSIAPVDNANNRLDDDEKVLIKTRMIFILATESIVFLILYLLKLFQYSKLLALVIFETCMLALIGKLENMITRDEKQ